MNDAISQFRDAMRAAGLEPPDVIEPGKFQRFPGVGKRNGNTAGWCKLFDDGLGGCFGDWSSGFSENWQAKREKPFSPAEREAFRRHVAETRAQAEAERKARQAEAVAMAAAIWNAAAPAPDDHVYLLTKGVRSHGLRVHEGALVVPVGDGEELCSLQFIAGDGTKRFLAGGRVSGCYFLIGKPGGALCIAEGYATAASIHEATGYAVAAAFNAQNLVPVARALRAKFPDMRLIICADDDAWTGGNPGLSKAREAARAVGGMLAVPDFGPDRPADATDFNDLCSRSGPARVRSCVEAAAPVEAADEAPHRPAAFQVVHLDGLAEASIDPTIFAIDKILPRGHITLLGAHGGAGKSILALTFAAHVAAGRPWAGLAAERGHAVFASLEDSGDLLKYRLKRICDAYALPHEAIAARCTLLDGAASSSTLAIETRDGGITRLEMTTAMAELEAAAAGSVLVVIDNATDAYSANENDRRLVRDFMRRLAHLARQSGCAVLLLAHIDKAAARYGAGANSYSGSTAWHNAARSRLALVDDEAGPVLAQEKSNLGPKIEPLPLEWVDGVLAPVPTSGSAAVERQGADDAAVLAAIEAASSAGEAVYAARSGPYSALRILKHYPELPEQLHSAGRFYAALNRLERSGRVLREEFRTPQRRVRVRLVPRRCADASITPYIYMIGAPVGARQSSNSAPIAIDARSAHRRGTAPDDGWVEVDL